MKKRIVFSICFLIATMARASFLKTPQTVEKIQHRLSEIPLERSYRTRAVLLSELGTLYYRQGRFEEAIEAFDNSLTYGPPTVLKKHIYLYLGKSYESSGRIDKAISAYEQAVNFDKRNWKRYRDLGGLYEREHLLEKAVASYESALRYNPKEATVHFSLGRIYRQVSQYEKAETHFVTALDLGQSEKDVFSELSFVFEAQGKFSEAASACDETLTDASSQEEWARLVYLAALGRQTELAAKGMAGLRKKNVTDETIRFYEALIRYAEGRSDINDPSLKGFFKETMQ
jgi:tetratricopeptide (TPR) repeat protein